MDASSVRRSLLEMLGRTRRPSYESSLTLRVGVVMARMAHGSRRVKGRNCRWPRREWPEKVFWPCGQAVRQWAVLTQNGP